MSQALLLNCIQCGHANSREQQVCTACHALIVDSAQNSTSSQNNASSSRSFQEPSTPSWANNLAAIYQPNHIQDVDVIDAMIDQQIGNFRLIKKLGEGGFGAVYLAEHVSVEGYKVAIKILRTELQNRKELQKRFEQEAKAIASLRHKNVVQLIDFGTLAQHQRCYLVMEYLEGKTLHQCLEDQEPFPILRIMPMFQQICSVLHDAHSLKIFHRDLKPANLFLTHDRFGHDEVKVIDFGIAKMKEGDTLTCNGMVMGSPTYMSPEQAAAKGHLVNGRSDLYSLAIVLFKILTGSTPFEGETSLVVLAHQQTPPPRLSEIVPTYRWTQELEAFFVRALAKDPHLRPADATTFWQECYHALQCQKSLEASHSENIVGQPVLYPATLKSVTPFCTTASHGGHVIVSNLGKPEHAFHTPAGSISVGPTQSLKLLVQPNFHTHLLPIQATSVEQPETLILRDMQSDLLKNPSRAFEDVDFAQKTDVMMIPFQPKVIHPKIRWIWWGGSSFFAMILLVFGIWRLSPPPHKPTAQTTSSILSTPKSSVVPTKLKQNPTKPLQKIQHPDHQRVPIHQVSQTILIVETNPSLATFSHHGKPTSTPYHLQGVPGSRITLTFSKRGYKTYKCIAQFPSTGSKKVFCTLPKKRKTPPTKLLILSTPPKAMFTYQNRNYTTPKVLSGSPGQDVSISFKKVGHRTTTCLFTFPTKGRKTERCNLQPLPSNTDVYDEIYRQTKFK